MIALSSTGRGLAEARKISRKKGGKTREERGREKGRKKREGEERKEGEREEGKKRCQEGR